MKKSNFTHLSLIECFKTQYQDVQEIKINNYSISISIPCITEMFSDSIIYESISIKQNSIFLINQETNTNISIWNDEKFDHNCFKKSIMKTFKGKIKLRFIKKEQLIIFDDNLLIYFFDCQQNKIIFKTNLNTTIFEYNEKYYINENTSNIFNIVQVMENQINLYQQKIDGKIMQVKVFFNYLVLNVNNQKLPMLLDMDSITHKYISKNLFQSEDILFYKEIGQAKFIQYQYLLAFEFFGIVKCFEFTGVQIVDIFKYLIGEFQILAIQKTTDSLFYYYFDQYAILPLQNFTLPNYSISYPIKYLSSFQQFIILLENNNYNYIAIFKVIHTKIILNEIIQTSDSFFIYFNNNLLYNDTNQEFRQKYLKNIFIAIQSQSIINNVLFFKYQFSLNQITPAYTLNFQLLIQNNCQKVQYYKNNIQIKLKKDQNLQLKISDYFNGPVDKLIIKNGSQIYLKGPFLLNQQILDCLFQYSEYCFREYHLINKKDQTKSNKLKVFILDSIIILKQSKYDLIQLYFNIFYITDNFYVLIKQQFEQLQLQIIILDQESFIEISNFIISLPKTLKNIEIKKIGNIISLDFNQTYFFISNLTINQIYLPDQVIDIQQIENIIDLYIGVKVSFGFDQNIELLIYRINNFNDIKVIYTQIITQEISNLFNVYINFFSLFKEIKFGKCSYSLNIIIVNLLIVFEKYSIVTYLQINIEDNCIEKFEVLQYIRNQGEYDYMNNNILVQKQQQIPVDYIYYDLREDQQYKDYIFRTNQQIQIQILNTTHNVFINYSEYYIGTFGYEIEFENHDNIIQNVSLEAQNQVSSIELYMQITLDKNNSKFSNTIFIVLLLNLTFIGTYINRYKKKQIYNLEHI